MKLLQNYLLLMISILSSATVESTSCLMSNVSFVIRSNPNVTDITIQSNLFTKSDLIKKCDDDFMKIVFNESCSNILPIHSTKNVRPTKAESYIYGLVAVLAVSLLSIAALLAFPLLYNASFKYVLSLFSALAVGTLFGDTMFHLIPFTLGLHEDHIHNDDHMKNLFIDLPAYEWKMLVIVSVLYGFYLLDSMLHSFTKLRHRHSNVVALNQSMSSDHSPTRGDTHELMPMNHDIDFENSQRLPDETNSRKQSVQQCFTQISVAESLKSNRNNSEHTSKSKQESKNINTIGWMVLIGDGIHNFADGLAMGAAFSQDLVLGVTTTIAIGLHELPHELGDYAVLIQSGFTHYRALFWNFISATTAIIGFFVGVISSDNDDVRRWIFTVTIGMFMYIALVDLLPTLIEDGHNDIKRFFIINFGLLFGIIIMFLLALFEEKLIQLSKL